MAVLKQDKPGSASGANREANRPDQPARFRGRAFQVMLAALVLCAGLIPTRAHAQVSREYQLKAVFLYNFAQFTEWTTNAGATNQPMVIGIVGTDPFGPALDETVRGEEAHQRKLVVERYARMEDIKPCNILYISSSESRRLNSILDKVKNKPILTVSDLDGPASHAVMIRFITENNRIRLRIDLDSVKQAGLTLSSKLLRAAEVVPANSP